MSASRLTRGVVSFLTFTSRSDTIAWLARLSIVKQARTASLA